MTHLPTSQIVTYEVVEKGSGGQSMMNALNLLQAHLGMKQVKKLNLYPYSLSSCSCVKASQLV